MDDSSSETEALTSSQPRSGSILLGGLLIVIGGAALALVGNIRQAGLVNNNDPGPKLFPMLLGTLLAAGGLFEAIHGFVGMIVGPASPQDLGELPKSNSEDAWRSLLRVTLLLAILALYIAAIDWLGFSLSTLVVSAGLMIWLAKENRRESSGGKRTCDNYARRNPAPLYRLVGSSLLLSAGLVLVIQLLFVWLFERELPTGQLGLPF